MVATVAPLAHDRAAVNGSDDHLAHESDSRSQTIDSAEDSAVKNTVIVQIPGNMNVLKFTLPLEGRMLERPLGL